MRHFGFLRGKMKNLSRRMAVCAVCMVQAATCGAATYAMDKQTPVRTLSDSHRYDLRPGLRIACRVKFDASIAEKREMTIVRKGNPNTPGSFLLRVDGSKESVKFSFFLNHGAGPEPRVSIPGPVLPDVWYDIVAGWDGTNSFITVNGRTAKKRRSGDTSPIGCDDSLHLGPMRGMVENLSITGPETPPPADVSCCAGFRIACRAKFLAPPSGETTILYKSDEYWLRYDGDMTHGRFNFYVKLDGSWEPRVSYASRIEIGRVYSLSAGWTGTRSWIGVDGEAVQSVGRTGLCRPSKPALVYGKKGVVEVSDFCIRNEKKPIVTMGEFRTRELLPRLGAPAHLAGTIYNVGLDVGACTLEATTTAQGATVSPARVELDALACGTRKQFEWVVDAGTNGTVTVGFVLRQGEKTVHNAYKRVVFLPAKDPDFSAKAWNPPQSPGRTYHVDSAAGDDARDGLTPATAWKTLAKVASLTLGPGERLLLKRGSVFKEEFRISAHGSADNWAEIGAYGEGMRPQIVRNRHINERCAIVLDPSYLVVRDLVFCNAGSGLSLACDAPGTGHVLIERCLAHHIEGMYRFNSHGVPDWRDEPGVAGRGGRSCGLWAGGSHARHVVMRDCESYQCSSGFRVSGLDTFVTRMFCHDNYAHNTSPHPYNLASRSWMTDCLFDASGWHAAAGTMGIMLAGNCGYVIRGCHFINQPDSGSPDQGGIDFEAGGENCLVENCTFRNNAGAAIEVLGLRSPQTRNVHIRRCKFDRNNYSFKNGPAEIQVWGSPGTSSDVACSNGLIEDNGYVLVPGVPFYVNNSRTTNDWTLARNREFDFPEELDRAYPYVDPPEISVCGEIWTDRPEAALFATSFNGKDSLSWEQTEGPANVVFGKPHDASTKAVFPAQGDYRVIVKADNGTLWRTARTAVHVLPPGARTFRAWDFAKNLDAQGWRAENTGIAYEVLPSNDPLWESKAFPVQIACGDYLLATMKDAGQACLVTSAETGVGVSFVRQRVNAFRIKMQNRTNSRRMRLWWQKGSELTWDEKDSVAFDVKPMDNDDSVYEAALPHVGVVRRLKLSFSADGENTTGTCRIDYIWLGNLTP